MNCGWLFWDKENQNLFSAEGNTKKAIQSSKSITDISLPSGEIHKISCLVDKSWQLSIEQTGSTSFFLSKNGIQWDLVPQPPLVNKVAESAFGFLPERDNIFAIEKDEKLLHFFRSENGWNKLDLPEGAEFVSLSRKGIWWAVGGKTTSRIKGHETEVAAWVRKDEKKAWIEIPIRSSWWQTFKAIDKGGYHALLGLNIDCHPIVFLSECCWFYDEQSFFTFTLLPSGCFNIQRFKHRMIARFNRDEKNNLIIMTCDGEQWHWNGKKWIPKGIGDIIRRFLDCPSYYYKSLNYNVNLAIHHNGYYGFIRNGIPEGKYADCNILIKSIDYGANWEVVDILEKENNSIEPIAVWAK